MKLLRLYFTLIASLILASCEKPNTQQVAQETFVAVREGISDESLTSLEDLIMKLEPGISELHEFMRLCDENLVSDDEVTRSTAYWCAETITILAHTGDVRIFDRKTRSQLGEATKYEWQNGAEIGKLGTDSEYLKSRLPSYEAFRKRSSPVKTGNKDSARVPIFAPPP